MSWTSPFLAFASLFSVALGGLVSGILPGSIQWVDDEVTVPYLRVGDNTTWGFTTASYGVFKAPPRPPGGGVALPPVNPTSGGVANQVGLYEGVVERLGPVADSAGEEREAILLRQSWYDLYIDLGYNVIRSLSTDGWRAALRTEHEFLRDRPVPKSLFLQGRTFRLGEPVEVPLLLGFDIDGPSWGYAAPWRSWEDNERLARGDLSVFDADDTVRASVLERGVVLGHDSLLLRLEIVDVDARTACYGPDECLKQGLLRMHVDVWVTGDLPHPPLVEQRIMGMLNGERIDVRTARWTHQHRAGSGPEVVWRDNVPPVKDANERMERSPQGSRVPADGQGFSLPYPLSQALRDVEEDPTLLEYRLWSMRHPDAILVQASMSPGPRTTADAATASWRLTFGAPGGEAWTLLAERAPGESRVTITRGSEIQEPEFANDPRPERPIALAAALEAWRAIAEPGYREQPPNFVHWASRSSSFAPTAACQDAGSLPVLIQPHLTVGWAPPTTCDFSSEKDLAFLALNTTSGLAIRHMEGGGAPPSMSPTAVSASVPSAEIVGPGPFGWSGPTAAATTTLLLFGLACLWHWWGLVRWRATQLLLLVGYSKITKDEVLDHRLRDLLLEQIRQNPGIHASALARRLSIGWGTLVHHLSVLERNELVSSLPDGRHKRFFAAGSVDWNARRKWAVLANERSRALYEAVQREPGIATSDLVRRARLSLPAAAWHLRRLQEVGLIERRKEGRRVRFLPLPNGGP